jgi:hypothetical protein
MSERDFFGGRSSDGADHGTRVIQTRVVDNCDDARLGRVMVQVPWLEGPVVASVSPRVQLIRTPGGHEVIFDDDTGELVINASGGQTVSLTKDGVEIRGSKPAQKLQDDAIVVLNSNGDVRISGRSITLEADSIDIKATSGECNINATGGACNIRGGPKVNIN